ncbi:uncharacterized protein OCT59_026206 [Rhizophagus irregularis]|uniref:uncharacterized protein n=1 Tax=Rhizophagus irregularis TaxID=588596 RepID=UPI003323B342|nr:hypothetical protein OCT59_026206 [Rhizophagus irregularis]
MPRPRKYRVNRDRSKVTKSGPKTRNLVECKCLLFCGEQLQAITTGSQASRSRGTGKKHNISKERKKSNSSNSSKERKKRRTRVVENLSDTDDDEESERNDDEESERNDDGESEQNDGEESERNDDDENDNEIDNKPIDGLKRRKRHNKFRDINLEQPTKLEPVQLEDKVPSDDDGASTTDEDDIPIEEFTAPDFNDLESDHKYFNTNINFNDSWILLWIFKYQARFRIPDVAIESFIKFFRMVLLDTDRTRFENLPTSFYIAKKLLGINKRNRTCAVCPECNTLYKISEILPGNPQNETNTGFQCTHVEFPNHPMRNKRRICGTELTNKVSVVNGFV